MMKVQTEAEKNIQWVIGSGNVNFWFDRWCGNIRVTDLVTHPRQLCNKTVREVMADPDGCIQVCETSLHYEVIRKIKNMGSQPSNKEDVCIWTPSQNGKFSLKTTWELCRNKNGLQKLNRLMWAHVILIKWSLLVWRAVRGRIPLDGTLQQKGIQLASQCNYCIKSSVETIDHLFVTSEKAQLICRFFKTKSECSVVLIS